MTGWVAMVPGTLRDGSRRCTEVAGQARAVADSLDGLPEPDGLPPHVSGQLRAAAAQLRRSAASADRQSAWLVHRSQKGLMADGPFGSVLDLTAPPLLSPWAMPRPPEKPLKVPDPAESLADRLFGRDYVLPEEAANVVLEAGVNPTRLLKVLGIGARGARRTRVSKPPGGGLKGHEERGGHTLERHVGKTEGDLRARLRNEPKIPAASAFTDRELAEDAVSAVLTINRETIKHLLHFQNGEARLVQSFDRAIGKVVTRDGTVTSTREITVVIVKDSSKLGYHVKTAFPSK